MLKKMSTKKIQITTPIVTSVNGKTGDVTLDISGGNIQQAVNHFPGIIRQLFSANQFLFRQFALGHKDTFFQSYLGMVT